MLAKKGSKWDLIGKIPDPWWHETLRLYGAQADASPIVAACLGTAHPTVAALSLAIDCLEEAREIAPEWRNRTESLLSEGVESSDPERFRLAAEPCWHDACAAWWPSRRVRSLIPHVRLMPNTSSSWKRDALKIDIINPITGKQSDSAGAGLTPVVGIRGSDAKAFSEWLSNHDSAFRARLPRIGELSALGLEEAIQGGTIE